MVDTKKLAGAVRAKRGPMSLRKAAEKSGIAYVVLFRIENEQEPDLNNFMQLCKWLGVPMDYFRVEKIEAA